MSTQRAAHDPLFGVDFTATDYNFTWLFLGFVMIVAIIGAIIDGIAALSAKKDKVSWKI
jgi:hypothetical protein